jgi:hypothetical protein
MSGAENVAYVLVTFLCTHKKYREAEKDAGEQGEGDGHETAATEYKVKVKAVGKFGTDVNADIKLMQLLTGYLPRCIV